VEIATRCAICGTLGNSTARYPASIDSQTFNTEVFSARRLPDQRHYAWVECNTCGLFRSDPVWNVDLTELYSKSTFDYSQELHGLKSAYKKILQEACSSPTSKSIVEIGGGNGFFLEEAQQMGFERVVEIEPSILAFEAASPSLKPFFIVDVVREGLITDNSEDVVVIFHVLDHLPDPLSILRLIHKMLKPGGSVCIAVHNVNSISSFLLKNKSPIFDVEHTFLYSKSTLTSLLIEAGFEVTAVKHYKNSYSLAYILHLIPIPTSLKKSLLQSKFARALRVIKIRAPLGNIYAIATK
jgi:SAM-dependent methyltransferase